jgi:lipopolysaccharide biosynthesis regulator YciM
MHLSPQIAAFLFAYRSIVQHNREYVPQLIVELVKCENVLERRRDAALRKSLQVANDMYQFSDRKSQKS